MRFNQFHTNGFLCSSKAFVYKCIFYTGNINYAGILTLFVLRCVIIDLQRTENQITIAIVYPLTTLFIAIYLQYLFASVLKRG